MVGVLVGVLITSGYNFWAIRRSELARGLTATHSLNDEARWLREGIDSILEGRGRKVIAPESVIEIWREQRANLVLFVDDKLFSELGAGIQVAQHLPLTLAGPDDKPLKKEDDDAARTAVALLDGAQHTLRRLAEVLRKRQGIM